MKLKLDGINNAGWSFTKIRMEQLMYLFEYIDSKAPSSDFKYRTLQDEVSRFHENLDASKVRMFFPWLHYYGVLNEYENITEYSELFTNLGKGFKQFVPIFVDVDRNSEQYTEIQIEEVNKTFVAFINNFYFNLLHTEKAPIYGLVVDILEKTNHLTFNEFFVLTHALRHDLDRKWIFETIQEMRDNSDNLEIEILSSQNAWGYIIPFLKEAGLIMENKRVIYLQKEDVK